MQPDNKPLKDVIDAAPWSWLRPHLMQDSIIVVSPKLVLHEVAERIAENDTNSVEHLITNQLLTKPSVQQISLWDTSPDTQFIMLIVRPYILIQVVA